MEKKGKKEEQRNRRNRNNSDGESGVIGSPAIEEQGEISMSFLPSFLEFVFFFSPSFFAFLFLVHREGAFRCIRQFCNCL